MDASKVRLRLRLLAALSLPLVGACKTEPGKGAESGSGGGEGPWAAQIASPGPGTMSTRRCFAKPQIAEAQKAPFSSCPSTGELVSMGLYSPPPAPPPGQMAMTGENMTEGPAPWNDQCCYLVVSWHTGRPLPVEGGLRSARTIRRGDWGARALLAGGGAAS